MGFSGRPSSACRGCREKRRRCDRREPGCSQCKRAKIVCLGYRPSTELRVRDETDRVTIKATATKKKKQSVGKKGDRSSACIWGEENSSGYVALGDVHDDQDIISIGGFPCTTALSQPKEVALVCFLSSVVVSTPYGRYLPELYLDNPFQEDALLSAMKAASFASFAKQVNDDRFLDSGYKEYSTALDRTNALLADPQTAVLDRTLAAVLTLGLFESITFQGQVCLENWMVHTLGTIQLLRMRGREQLERCISRHLYQHASVNIRISCIHRSTAVPVELLDLDKELIPGSGCNDNQYMDACSVMDRIAIFKSKFGPSNARDAGFVRELLRLEQDADALTQTASVVEKFPDMRARVTGTDELPDNAGTERDSERETGSVSGDEMRFIRWIFGFCLLRIPFLEHIVKAACASPNQTADTFQSELDPSTSPFTISAPLITPANIAEYAKRKMARLSDDVLHRVPGLVRMKDHRGRYTQAARCMVCPLAFLQTSTLCAPDVRREALRVLGQLREDLALPQASYAAGLVHGSRMAGDWLHLFHLF